MVVQRGVLGVASRYMALSTSSHLSLPSLAYRSLASPQFILAGYPSAFSTAPKKSKRRRSSNGSGGGGDTDWVWLCPSCVSALSEQLGGSEIKVSEWVCGLVG